jgi:hypothetical protein
MTDAPEQLREWAIKHADILRQRILVADLGECKRLTENALLEAMEKALDEAKDRVMADYQRAHTYASENADLYRAHDNGLNAAASEIQSLRTSLKETHKGREKA